MLGLDLGARFLRGAICDLRGEIRARQDVELDGADAEGAIDAIAGLRLSLAEASGLPADRIDGAVVGVPGVVDADTGRLTLATNVPGLEGRDWAEDLRARLELPVTVENDINLAAVGERWRGMARGVEDFVFLSVGTGLGAGLVLRGELHRGRHGAAGEVDLVAAGREEEIDPCASAVSALAERLVAENGASTTLRPPYDARGDLRRGARRRRDRAGGRAGGGAPDRAPHRPDLGRHGHRARRPRRRHRRQRGPAPRPDPGSARPRWLPYPPRVEVSSLGDAAVLTGALAVGLRSAVDNVFANRLRVTR